jgi:hypothetical protein
MLASLQLRLRRPVHGRPPTADRHHRCPLNFVAISTIVYPACRHFRHVRTHTRSCHIPCDFDPPHPPNTPSRTLCSRLRRHHLFFHLSRSQRSRLTIHSPWLHLKPFPLPLRELPPFRVRLPHHHNIAALPLCAAEGWWG